MCDNIDVCSREISMDRNELYNFCEEQGFLGPILDGRMEISQALITTPPKNVTVSEGQLAQFRCSADNTIKINIVKKSNADTAEDALVRGSPSTQTTIQEIESATYAHEGWYICTAYDVDGIRTTAEAYLEIRDICAGNDCQSPQVCKADEYTGTFECVCPGDCDNSFAPVCGSDCASYFNECTMKKETCERGLVGVTVASPGLCTFTPVKPRFEVSPVGGQTFDEGGAAIISARASGSPEPVYQWFKGDKLIGEGSDFTVTMSAKLSGTWRVEASNCHYTNTVDHEFEVKVAASNLVEPDMQCCQVYGDPHIMSFDKLKWDYMGSCTYILAQAKDAAWVVHGTFQPCGTGNTQISCITSITVFYKEEMIQFLRMFRINYMGEEFKVPFGTTKRVGELSIENKMMKYYVTIGDTGVRVMWDGIIKSETCLPNKCAGAVEGICGNADCDVTNEFYNRGIAHPVTGSMKASTSSEFGNSWAVDPLGCDLEPEDGVLPGVRERPCEYIPQEDADYYERRCRDVLGLDAFSNCVAGTTIDTEALLANCMYDNCVGLSYGGGCGKGAKADQCQADLTIKIAAHLLKNPGMGRAEAAAFFQGRRYDAACMMGMALADDCRAWGTNIGADWRDDVTVGAVCPGDKELANISMCD